MTSLNTKKDFKSQKNIFQSFLPDLNETLILKINFRHIIYKALLFSINSQSSAFLVLVEWNLEIHGWYSVILLTLIFTIVWANSADDNEALPGGVGVSVPLFPWNILAFSLVPPNQILKFLCSLLPHITFVPFIFRLASPWSPEINDIIAPVRRGRASQIENSFVLSYFSQKKGFKCHANVLLGKQFEWNVKSCFLEKIRNTFQNVVCWILPNNLTVNLGDKLHELQTPFSGKKSDKYFKMSSAEKLTQHPTH